MKWNQIKNILRNSLLLLMILAMAIPALAMTPPDEAEQCSLTVTAHSTDKIPAGAKVKLYRVAAFDEKGHLQLLDGWTLTKGSFEEEESAAVIREMAEELAAQTPSHTPDAQGQLDASGKAEFNRLSLGLYLTVTSCEGYEFSSSLFSLPERLEDETWNYDREVGLKYEEKTPDQPGPEPDQPEPDNPKPPLPQTGQLWWPVLLLAVLGMTSILVGKLMTKDESEQ